MPPPESWTSSSFSLGSSSGNLCLVFLAAAVPPLKCLLVRCHDTVHLQKLVYVTKSSSGPTSVTPQSQELRVHCFNLTVPMGQ